MKYVIFYCLFTLLSTNIQSQDTTVQEKLKMNVSGFLDVFYVYDFNKGWTFHVELINVSKEENPKITYPSTSRVEGIAPSQYGTKGLLGEKFADIEEKYDLTQAGNGFGEKDEDGEDTGVEDEVSGEEEEEV